MRIILLCLILIFISAPSFAEVLLQCRSYHSSPNCDYVDIVIKGLISPEDLSTFKRIVGAYNPEKQKIMTTEGEKSLGLGIPTVYLDSPGGDIMTALAIGDLVYKNQFAAEIDIRASCSSACVCILGSSVMRWPLGEIKIHRLYSNSIDTSFAQAASDFAKIERVAISQFKRVGVSADLWDAMMRVPPQATKRLEPEEIMHFGLLGTDPAYSDAMDSREAKHLGITKQKYLRRKAIEEKCIEEEEAKYQEYSPNLGEISLYCRKRAGTILMNPSSFK